MHIRAGQLAAQCCDVYLICHNNNIMIHNTMLMNLRICVILLQSLANVVSVGFPFTML